MDEEKGEMEVMKWIVMIRNHFMKGMKEMKGCGKEASQ